MGSATVSLVKSINKTVFTLGETVTYCIAWSNTGTAAVNISIWDTLNPVLTYVGSDNGGFATGNIIRWNLGVQAANTGGNVCVWAFINAYPALPPWRDRDTELAYAPQGQFVPWRREYPWGR